MAPSTRTPAATPEQGLSLLEHQFRAGPGAQRNPATAQQRKANNLFGAFLFCVLLGYWLWQWAAVVAVVMVFVIVSLRKGPNPRPVPQGTLAALIGLVVGALTHLLISVG